jgi:hypothetical protein
MTTKSPPTDHLHYFNYHTGRPRFHFDEAADAAAAAAAAAAAQKPWHDGVEPEILGHWQNKGWKVDDPKEIALAATRQAREAERHFGVPVDRLLKLPAADGKPEEWAPIYQRLGAPKDAKEYDFAGIKFAGADLEADFADAMRTGLAAAFVPKDRAKAIVESVVKYLESADSAEATINAGKIAAEKAGLAKNWGGSEDSARYKMNMMQAMQGAERSGISPEGIKAMEGQVGYAAVMEHFRKIGANTTEATFHENDAGGKGVATLEGAQARLAELEKDKAWAAKLKAKDAAAVAEWTTLMNIIGA